MLFTCTYVAVHLSCYILLVSYNSWLIRAENNGCNLSHHDRNLFTILEVGIQKDRPEKLYIVSAVKLFIQLNAGKYLAYCAIINNKQIRVDQLL